MNSKISLKQRLKNRERLFAGWVSYPYPAITETFAKAGFDFIAIDMEHSTISTEEAKNIITTSQSVGVPCLPRPVSHSNDWIKPLLESGADGMVIQMVNTKQQAENLIEHIYYPPIGNRSYGVNRAHGYGFEFDSYTTHWNDNAVCIIQIESIDGVNNIDEILSLEYIDGVMIGPMDLSGSLGIPGQVNHPDVIAASKRVIASCEKYNKSCGTQLSDTSIQNIDSLFDLGYTFAILGSDLFVLWKWAEQMKGVMQEFKK